MIKEITEKVLFEGTEIRRIFVDGELYLSVIDVIASLTDSENPRNYWNWMKTKSVDSDGSQLSRITVQLKLIGTDGKKYQTDCANIEGIFRIIQSIPSPKAEPFKRWLAQLGKERLEEIENPELGIQRARELYTQKGYPSEWIDKRLQAVSIRKNLTSEWKNRGAKEGLDFAALSNEIMKNAFGMKADEYKEYKDLKKKDELRDHMSELELVTTMVGEATTTELTKKRDSRGVPKLKRDARDGGSVAGRTRRDIEAQTGTKVISQENFLQNKKRKQIETELSNQKTIMAEKEKKKENK